MAFQEALKTITLVAGADYSDQSAHYRFIKCAPGARQFVRCNASGEAADGVCQDHPGNGHASCIGVSGISKVEAGAAVPPGSQIATDAQGRAIVASSGAFVLGTSVNGSNASGEIISVALDNNGVAA